MVCVKEPGSGSRYVSRELVRHPHYLHTQVPTEDKAGRFGDSSRSQGYGHNSEGQMLKPPELHGGEAHGTTGIFSSPDTWEPHFSLLPFLALEQWILNVVPRPTGSEIRNPVTDSSPGYLQTSPPLARRTSSMEQARRGILSDKYSPQGQAFEPLSSPLSGAIWGIMAPAAGGCVSPEAGFQSLESWSSTFIFFLSLLPVCR